MTPAVATHAFDPVDTEHVQPRARWRRHGVIAAAALLAAAVVFVRFWHLNTVGFNSDETVYVGQAASLAGDVLHKSLFPVFRAHPLLFQVILSIPFRLGIGDGIARVLAGITGVATVGVTFLVARELYNKRVAMLAALLLALMPYHVVVSRQVLLDGPLALFTSLSLYFLARFARSGRSTALAASGATIGLAVLSKEIAVVFVGAMFAFFALAPRVRLRMRDAVRTLVCVFLVVLPYPLSILIAGRSKTGGQYLIWQLFRRPNHGYVFYATHVPLAIGPLVLIAAAAGLWFLRSKHSWPETLLLSWVVVPVAFFELWPVKGFQYLLPIAVPIAVLAARTLDALFERTTRQRWVAPALLAVIVCSLIAGNWSIVRANHGTSFLAGSGGVAGGREAGSWIADHAPEGSKALAIGPSMANIIQYYGHRKAYGLSVSPNPLHRNPAYEPLPNPDIAFRQSDLHYVVWDAYSAQRSHAFSARLLQYAHRYHGRVVHVERVTNSHGGSVPVIIIFEVRP